MSSEIFYKVVNELSKLKFHGVVYLSYYNEPTNDPRLFLFTKFAKKKLPNCKIGFTTNGYYLDQNLANELRDYGIDGISVSIYSQEEHERLSKIKFNIPVTLRVYLDMVKQDGRIKFYEPPLGGGGIRFRKMQGVTANVKYPNQS
jgi:MoaA/NifB/PqqE/SkfB family radical SAM enzyme